MLREEDHGVKLQVSPVFLTVFAQSEGSSRFGGDSGGRCLGIAPYTDFFVTLQVPRRV
jgi:hypothetical protein